jgi:tRNA pseudouridine55 synthase
MFGVINLDKPVGPTSHDMVGVVRRLTGLRRIGHAGTLDPLASGVLPILVGPATRVSRELTGGRKRYDAVIRLGVRSETDDEEGPLTSGGTPPEVGVVRAVLPEFVGTIHQRPPAYSARKAGGVVAYEAARRGSALELQPREVTIHAIQLREAVPGDGWLDVHLDVETGPDLHSVAGPRPRGAARVRGLSPCPPPDRGRRAVRRGRQDAGRARSDGPRGPPRRGARPGRPAPRP